MAAALVQQANNSEGGVANTIAAALTGAASTNRLIMCITDRDGYAISGITDTVNGAWTLAGNGISAAAAARRAAIYSFPNGGAGNPTATATLAAASPKDASLSEWSGTGTGAADTSNSATSAAATSHSCGSITPSGASLLIAVLGTSADHGGVTAPAGFTLLTVHGSAQQRCAYAYKTGHTGAITPSFTTVNAVSSDAVVVAYLEAGGGGGGSAVKNRQLLLGVG